jgi:DNA-binding XRE family transcriptional regulator
MIEKTKIEDEMRLMDEMRHLMRHIARREKRPMRSELRRFHRYIARLFKTYRKTYKLTVGQFAKEIGGTVAWVHRIEAGTYDITLLDVFWIARFFSITAVDLIKDGGLR